MQNAPDTQDYLCFAWITTAACEWAGLGRAAPSQIHQHAPRKCLWNLPQSLISHYRDRAVSSSGHRIPVFRTVSLASDPLGWHLLHLLKNLNAWFFFFRSNFRGFVVSVFVGFFASLSLQCLDFANSIDFILASDLLWSSLWLGCIFEK